MSLRKAKKVVLAPSITVHTWNKDRSMVALSPNSKTIYIYKVKGTKLKDWGKPKYILKGHDQIVTDIDWAPNSNKILSCSQDRNAYVWTFDEETDDWKPSLVLLRINRAATCCKWGPNENKFAVGSSSKLVSVCYFEADNNWWVAKMVKKGIKSTVTSVDFHPTDPTLLAIGSTDRKVRIVDSFIKTADKKKKRKVKFGTILKEYNCNGWVNDVKFSPDNKTIAFVSHDCSMSFANIESVLNFKGKKDETEQEEEKPIEVVRYRDLPYRSMIFLSNNAIVAGGFDYVPVVFCIVDGKWKYIGRIDTGDKKKKETKKGVRSAFLRFQEESDLGKNKKTQSTKTRHHNSIVKIQDFQSKDGVIEKFTTSSLDGTVLFWKVSDIIEKYDTFKI